jgi:hypothetical protein
VVPTPAVIINVSAVIGSATATGSIPTMWVGSQLIPAVLVRGRVVASALDGEGGEYDLKGRKRSLAAIGG